MEAAGTVIRRYPGYPGVSDAAGCAGCGSGAAPGVQGPSGMPEDCRVFSFNGDREALKREMYRSLELYTGKKPEVGCAHRDKTGKACRRDPGFMRRHG